MQVREKTLQGLSNEERYELQYAVDHLFCKKREQVEELLFRFALNPQTVRIVGLYYQDPRKKVFENKSFPMIWEELYYHYGQAYGVEDREIILTPIDAELYHKIQAKIFHPRMSKYLTDYIIGQVRMREEETLEEVEFMLSSGVEKWQRRALEKVFHIERHSSENEVDVLMGLKDEILNLVRMRISQLANQTA